MGPSVLGVSCAHLAALGVVGEYVVLLFPGVISWAWALLVLVVLVVCEDCVDGGLSWGLGCLLLPAFLTRLP